MPCRFALRDDSILHHVFRVVLGLVASCLLVPAAQAVDIAPDLEAALFTKTAGDRVPVLMLFHDPGRGKSTLPGLDAMDPEARRRLVLDALKDRAHRENLSVHAVLDAAARRGEVTGVKELYLAGAILFEANAAGVAAVAALPESATLHHDPPRDLTSAARTTEGPNLTKAADQIVWNLKYVRAPLVWSELGFTGAGVVVGHIDTGAMLAHSDLKNGLWVNPGEIPDNGLDDDGNGFVDDIHGYDFGDDDGHPDDDSRDGGHGTHTAGTIVGDGTGGLATGVAPGAQLMVTKVYRADGGGGSLGTIWAAQQYCVENGARLLSMSLVLSGHIPVTFLRSERFNDGNIRDAGVTLFNSAGNEFIFYQPPLELGLTARVPAPWNALPVPHSSTGGVISVGGIGYKTDERYPLSSRGPARWDHVDPWHDWPLDPGPGLIKPDIALPGVYVNSTVITGGYSGDTWSGTSMSCPHAAGIAALMLEKNPTLSPAGIDSLMELNAVDLGEPGKDNEFGSGRVDAFTVVSAVPEVRLPDLVWTDLRPDPEGDAVLEPGNVEGLAVVIRNNAGFAEASGVQVQLAVAANPYVTVIASEVAMPGLASGESADNMEDAFELTIAPDAPQGFGFTLFLTVTADGGYQRTFDRVWYVGLPEWRTHDVGRVFLTVTDQGILGYMGIDHTAGMGMGKQGFGSDLFLGSFWAGTGPDYVCNRDYEGLGSETYEWEAAAGEINGRVRDLGDGGTEQMFEAAFTDNGHPNPKPLLVKQTSLALAGPPDDDYVILEYQVTNLGGEDLDQVYTGLYCDFDVGADGNANQAGTDPELGLAYQFDPQGLYYGIVPLGNSPAVNFSVVSNPTYVYQASHVVDEDKFGLLSGAISHPDGNEESDYSIMVSTVLDLEADGGQGTTAFALVVGEDKADLLLNAEAAKAAYAEGISRPGTVPVPPLTLAQNQPNPFNPTTRIGFTLEKEGPVVLTVYDLRGTPIRTLLKEVRSEGDHEVSWDGRDSRGVRMSSGLYLYRLEAEGTRLSRKMMLLK